MTTKDWITKFKENVLIPRSVNLDHPSSPGSRDPTEWGMRRKDLIQYIENLHYFGQLFYDLEFMNKLFERYKLDEDIINDFFKSFEHDIEGNYTVRQKKNQRYKHYTNNLFKAFKKIENEDERKEFFFNARFPISTLYDQDIEIIIDEFLRNKSER
ncbi:22400_t:CDS:1 [Dentiscutata erythropus]|uniref:22400_t:CDS:1 n=1 Tax=Dentiscutata erythropus TaxID=1348616 RepID=A0A9N9G639_9GLOM|nr:22400_t:CDS:1 [Dentiscutata erythropus]